MTSCTATVLYTPAAGYAGIDAFTYQVSDGVLLSNVATVTVAVTGAPLMPPPATLGVGEPYVAVVTGVLLGATVDFGDDTGDQLLIVDAEGSAPLEHVYVEEWSYAITVTNPSGLSATTFAHVLMPGLGSSSTETVPAGTSGGIELPGLTATLMRAPGNPGDATLVAALYPPSLPGFFVGGLFGAPLAAFDLRVIDAGDGDSATVTFGYPDPGVPALPALTFFGPVSDTFEPVAGSTSSSRRSRSIRSPVWSPWCSTRRARRRCGASRGRASSFPTLRRRG